MTLIKIDVESRIPVTIFRDCSLRKRATVVSNCSLTRMQPKSQTSFRQSSKNEWFLLAKVFTESVEELLIEEDDESANSEEEEESLSVPTSPIAVFKMQGRRGK